MRIALMLFPLLLGAAIQPVRADFSLSFDEQGRGCTPELAAVRLSAGRLRFDGAHDGRSYSGLYDGGEQALTLLDHQGRTVRRLELDDDQLDYQKDVGEATGKYVDNELAKAQKQMAQMCEDMKKRGQTCPDMSGMMNLKSMMAMSQQVAGAQGAGGAPQGAGPFAPTGARAEAAGIACAIEEQRAGAERVAERCVAGFDALGLEPRQLAALERALKRMQRYGDAARSMADAFLPEEQKRQQAPTGLPLRQACFQDGRETGRAEGLISREPIEGSVFETPADYRPVDATTGQ